MDLVPLLPIEVQGKRLPGNRLLQFQEEAAGDKTRGTVESGLLGSVSFPGTHSTLKGLYKVRSLGTVTLSLNLVHIPHLTIPVNSAQRVKGVGGSR